MTSQTTYVAVQISNVSSHPAVNGRSGAIELALLVIGLILAIHSLVGLSNDRRRRAKGRFAHALVVENLPKFGAHRSGLWQALVEFDADGARVVSRLNATPRRLAYQLGASVDVLYDPADPHRIEPAESNNPAGTWLIVGLVIVILAVTI
jgi:hypothetical protein